MDIHESKELVDTGDIRLGIATEQPFKICVHKAHGKDLKPLMDKIEANFRVYQYKLDNGVEYQTEDLFFWTNTLESDFRNGGELKYFDLNLNSKQPVEKRREILDRLLKIIGEWDGSPVNPGVIRFRSDLDGTMHEVVKSGSSAYVEYHTEPLDRETIHFKALENMKSIGKSRCLYCGMLGHFRHDNRNGSLFQKLHTRKFYLVSDEFAVRAKVA